MPDSGPCDVVVVGAGTAGTAAALLLAQGGLRVTLVEARAAARAGARWASGIPTWAFERSGLGLPHPDEEHPRPAGFSLRSRN